MKYMEHAVILFVAVLFGLLSVALIVGVVHTIIVESNSSQALFHQGTIPHQLPDGFYKGKVSADIPRGSWQGKVFSATAATGTNQFDGAQRYHFKMYPAKGLRDKHTDVLRIDYRQPGNPLWLSFIVDEVVLTRPGHFLGKVHLHIAGLTFTLAYFELDKSVTN